MLTSLKASYFKVILGILSTFFNPVKALVNQSHVIIFSVKGVFCYGKFHK